MIEPQKTRKFCKRLDSRNSKKCQRPNKLSAHIAMSRIISNLNSFSVGNKSMQVAAKIETYFEAFKKLTMLI